MLITLNQLKKSLQALKNFLLAKIPDKTSLLTNDSGFITTNEETDPTVPSWAKNPTKPTYTASEVGALPSTTKIPTKASDLVDDSGHYTKPSGGIPASDLADGVVPVEDVQINGTSIVNEGVADIPKASSSTFGVIKAGTDFGTDVNANGVLYLYTAGEATIKSGSHSYQAIPPSRQHRSVFYGLAKVAGHDEKDSTLALGTYSEEAKSAIQTMLGVDTAIADAVAGVTVDSIPTTEIDTLFA